MNRGKGGHEGEAERRDDHVDAAVGEAVAEVECGGAAERGDDRDPAVAVDEAAESTQQKNCMCATTMTFIQPRLSLR